MHISSDMHKLYLKGHTKLIKLFACGDENWMILKHKARSETFYSALKKMSDY